MNAEDTIETYNLEPGEIVRFQETEAGTWHNAKYIGISKDQCIDLIDQYTGASRTIRPFRVERKVTGPKGGKSWKPIIDQT